MSNDLRAQVQQLQRQAAEAVARGDAAEAQRIGDALLSLDSQALAGADPAITRDLLDATAALVGAGDLPRAERLLLKGIQALSGNARATQADLIVPLNNLMAVYDQAGNTGHRDNVAAVIGGIAERVDGPLPASAVNALLQLGQIFERRENYAAALVMYRPVHDSMMARRDAAADVLLTWLLAYARVLVAGGRSQDGLAIGRHALDAAERAVEIDPVDRLQAFTVVARTASRLDEPATAQDALERGAAVAEALQTGGRWGEPKLAAVAGVVYHNLASLYVGLGRPEHYPRAETLMRRALALVLEQGRAGSAEHAGALGQLAVITEARGDDLDAADRLYSDSIAIYERAPDTSSAEFSDFLTDLGCMRLRRGHSREAVGPLRRAVELREASPGEPARRRADAASNLATAYFDAGDLAEAGREYTRALDLRFTVQA
jgi:tetratricopeptide (TPR) repeat protein